VKLAIELDNVTVRLGTKDVLKGLSIQVAQGTICGLLGPNGSGKTTLCRVILGLLRPQTGSCRLFGHSIVPFPRLLYNEIAVVADWQELPGYMSVSEYFAYQARLYERWDGKLCAKYASDFSLPLPAKIHTLSKGVQAKLALISALVVRSKILIADEPFGGIDIGSKRELMELFVTLAGNEKRTIIISSHHGDELEKLCDSLAFLTNKRIVLHESLQVIQDRYRYLECIVPEAWSFENDVPSDWLNAHVTGRVFSALLTNYDQATTADVLRTIGLREADLSLRTMSVEDVYLAVVEQFKKSTE